MKMTIRMGNVTEELVGLKGDKDNEEIAVDDGDIKAFEEKDDSDTDDDDGEASSDEAPNSDQSDTKDRILAVYQAELAF